MTQTYPTTTPWDETRPLEERAWAFAVKFEPGLRAICRRRLPPRASIDEMYSDVVHDRIVSIFETYRKEKGPLVNHVFTAVRWYALKWCKAHVATRATREPHEHHAVENPDIETRLEVLSVLDRLDETSASLLWWRDAEGFTIEEIALALGVPKTRASTMYDEALEAARRIVSNA